MINHYEEDRLSFALFLKPGGLASKPKTNPRKIAREMLAKWLVEEMDKRMLVTYGYTIKIDQMRDCSFSR